MGKAYIAMLDLKPGDEFEIKLGKKQIKLIPLGSTEEEWVTWTPETEPALMRASLPARLGQEKPDET
jgi:hypothetical protein